jgi:hypothetical protein
LTNSFYLNFLPIAKGRLFWRRGGNLTAEQRQSLEPPPPFHNSYWPLFGQSLVRRAPVALIANVNWRLKEGIPDRKQIKSNINEYEIEQSESE